MTTTIDRVAAGDLLRGLLGRPVSVVPADDVVIHPAAARGLVDRANRLRGVIGADLAFAHASAAAMAMLPPARVDDLDGPDDELIEIFGEVANVLSRLANESSADHVRLDPAIDHDPAALQAVATATRAAMVVEADISGFGAGRFGIWMTPLV